MPRSLFLTNLDDPRWRRSQPGVRSIFFPALHGLPAKHAETIALLPIHDANLLLIQAMDKVPIWPAHGWACVIVADPFRRPQDMLGHLKSKGVKKVCGFPTLDLLGAEIAATLDQFNLGWGAESAIAQQAAELQLEFTMLKRTDVGFGHSSRSRGLAIKHPPRSPKG